jgi:hypothetical protein
MRMKLKTMLLPRRAIPDMARVRQKFPSRHIPDVRSDTREKLLAAGLAGKIRRGARIAITAGSRGIGGFRDLIAGISEGIRAAGGIPFIVPAMGSHGGATSKGQTEILRRLGITEKTVNAPVRATMETVPLGKSKSGAVAHVDRFAAGADGIIVLGRVKTHPESATGLASGLLKMTTIGLGKQVGAQQAHSHGLWESVRAVPRLTMAKAKVLFGVAVVENAYRQPVVIEVVSGDYEAFLDADERLLKVAKPLLAKIPFQDLDLLIVDEIGKTISGSGMDLNVIGHWRARGGRGEPNYNYKRIVALSLTRGSLGNGLGLGLADFTTQRLLKDYDPEVTYLNLLTATEPNSTCREGPVPLALGNDLEAIEVGLYSSLAGENPRVCRIKSTAGLEELWVSKALLSEVKSNPKLAVLDGPAQMCFDRTGNLV